MLVSVEPNISIGYLNKALIRLGYTLPVVPELDNLTVGGLINGGGIESTSHKYGLFHHIATEYEVINANGDVIIANQQENNEYFHAIPMRYKYFVVLLEYLVFPWTFSNLNKNQAANKYDFFGHTKSILNKVLWGKIFCIASIIQFFIL